MMCSVSLRILFTRGSRTNCAAARIASCSGSASCGTCTGSMASMRALLFSSSSVGSESACVWQATSKQRERQMYPTSARFSRPRCLGSVSHSAASRALSCCLFRAKQLVSTGPRLWRTASSSASA